MSPLTQPGESPAPERPVNPLDFFYADYEFARAFDGWHARMEGDTHPLLTPQILLHKPLQLTSTAHTAAHARIPQRNCAWWIEWNPSPLVNVYYGFHTDGDDTYLMVFVQPQPGHQQPMRLAVCLVKEGFPKVGQLWLTVGDYLATLPPIAAMQTN